MANFSLVITINSRTTIFVEKLPIFFLKVNLERIEILYFMTATPKFRV